MGQKPFFHTQSNCQDIAKLQQHKKPTIYSALRGEQDKKDRNQQRVGKA
jgi:hypothetical protein